MHQSCQLGHAATIVGSRPSLPSPVFPDGPSCPLPNIDTTAGVGGMASGGTCPVLTCRPFAGINLPPPEVLKESCPVSQSSHGRAATHSEPLKVNYPPDEKKRRSNSCPRGEAEPKDACSSGAEPSWNLSQIGGRHSDKAPSQPAREPEAPESTSKLKSVVRKVRLDKAKPVNFEDLGPATGRYDTTGQDRTPRDKSRPHTESSVRSKDDHPQSKPRSGHSDRGPSHSNQRSGRHDRNSSQSPNQKSAQQKDESLAAKLMAHKEQEKHYKKVVENPMLYLEERYHQINPAEHQLEVHSMRFFRAGAKSAAIEVLAIIDWATKFLELSRLSCPGNSGIPTEAVRGQ